MDEPPSLDFVLSITADVGLVYPAIYLLAVALLLILAFIAASEVAFVSILPDDLQRIRDKFTGLAKVALFDQPNLLLPTIRLLNIIVRISLTTILALILFDERRTGSSSAVYRLSVIAGSVVFAELISKLYAQRFARQFAQRSTGTWWKLARTCRPLINLFDMTKEVPKTSQNEQRNVADEYDRSVENDILTGITAFGKLTVRQVMRSRTEISAIDSSSNFKMLMDIVDKCGFSRIPVYRNTIETIEGVLYIKDLLPFLDHPNDFQWRSLVRPGFFVNENRKIDSLLKDFQEKKVHMAIVVDEQVKTIGLVTLEDLIEEIIGEINDEFDDIDPAARNRKKTRVFVHEQH